METQTRINFLPRKTIYTYKYIICIICKKHVKKWIFKSPCPSYNTRHLHGLTMGSRPATSPGRALNLPVFSPQSWTITGSNAGRRVAVVRFLVASLLEERSDNFLVRWYPHEFFIFLLLLQHNHMLQCCPFSWPDKKQHFNNLTPSGDFDSQEVGDSVTLSANSTTKMEVNVTRQLLSLHPILVEGV